MCLLAARGRKAPAPARAPTFPLIPAALLVYRVFRNEAKRATKILHGLLHVFAFIIALVGEFRGSALPPPYWPPPPSPFQASQAGTLAAGTRAQKSLLVRFPLGPHQPVLT